MSLLYGRRGDCGTCPLRRRSEASVHELRGRKIQLHGLHKETLVQPLEANQKPRAGQGTLTTVGGRTVDP